MIGIYKITNKVNNKCYIGQSVNIERRWHEHKTRANKEWTGNHEHYSILSRAIRKYGIQNFEIELIEECPAQELDKKEIYYISYFNSQVPFGYNLSAGGSQKQRTKLTDEQYESLIYELANTKTPYRELALKYNITLQYISYINVGKYLYNERLEYPIRKTQKHYKSLPNYNKNILSDDLI